MIDDAIIIEGKLIAMSEILFKSDKRSRWGKKLSAIANKNTLHIDDLKFPVKKLYGGMGSLNDIVFMDTDGSVDTEANEAFDELRIQLYDIVH